MDSTAQKGTDKCTDARRQFKTEKLQAVIQSLGYAEQEKRLEQEGFDRVGRNIKLLIKFNGDVEQVLQRLKTRGDKGEKGCKHRGNRHGSHSKHRSHSKQRDFAEKIKERGFEAANNSLKEMGFTDDRRNFRVLKRTKGDVNEASLILTQDKAKHETQGQEHGHGHGHGKEHHGQGYWKEKREQKQKEIVARFPELQQLEADLKAKQELLEKEGFAKRCKNIKILALFNGDVVKTLDFLKRFKQDKDERRQKKAEQKAQQKADEKPSEKQTATQ